MSGSIESNTEENLHFETVYENIFEKCDVNLTGQVKTMDLGGYQHYQYDWAADKIFLTVF